MISPVTVGDFRISRSAAVTSSSSGSSLRCALYQIELDDAPAGSAVVDRVVGDAAPVCRRTPTYRPSNRHCQLSGRPTNRTGTPRLRRLDHEWDYRALRVGARQRGDGVDGCDRGNARIRILRGGGGQDQHGGRCAMPPSRAPARSQSSQRSIMNMTSRHRRHRCFACRPRRNADRRVVEPQHQHIAFDPAGGSSQSPGRARPDRDLEPALGEPNDLLAGEPCRSIQLATRRPCAS